MKFYTEQVLRNSMNSVKYYMEHYDASVIDKIIDNHINALAPIELPTDEEIGKGRDENIPIDEKDMWSERFYFNIGAKWVVEQLKQDKQ